MLWTLYGYAGTSLLEREVEDARDNTGYSTIISDGFAGSKDAEPESNHDL